MTMTRTDDERERERAELRRLVTVPLRASQVLSLARLARQAKRRKERLHEKHPFTPEPGCADQTELSIYRYDALMRTLLDVLDMTEDDLLATRLGAAEMPTDNESEMTT